MTISLYEGVCTVLRVDEMLKNWMFLLVLGEGRVVGGKKPTIITISPIGDNLVLHSREVLPLHSQASAIPVCIYDGREYLGDNEFMCPL